MSYKKPRPPEPAGHDGPIRFCETCRVREGWMKTAQWGCTEPGVFRCEVCGKWDPSWLGVPHYQAGPHG